jgi:hypothetical protein
VAWLNAEEVSAVLSAYLLIETKVAHVARRSATEMVSS